MSQDMSFGQALHEAKQLIVQQATRIKADAEKVRTLQQTVLDQSSTISEHDHRIREQSETLGRRTEEVAALEHRLSELTTAREQAEAIIDRQGQRLTTLQASNTELEERVSEIQGRINELTHVRDELLAQLPSKEDADALAEMAELLTTKKVSVPVSRAGNITSMRVVSSPMIRAEAA